MLRPVAYGVSSPMVMVDSGWFTSAGLTDYNKSVSYCKIKTIKNLSSNNTSKLTVHYQNRPLSEPSIIMTCHYPDHPLRQPKGVSSESAL